MPTPTVSELLTQFETVLGNALTAAGVTWNAASTPTSCYIGTTDGKVNITLRFDAKDEYKRAAKYIWDIPGNVEVNWNLPVYVDFGNLSPLANLATAMYDAIMPFQGEVGKYQPTLTRDAKDIIDALQEGSTADYSSQQASWLMETEVSVGMQELEATELVTVSGTSATLK